MNIFQQISVNHGSQEKACKAIGVSTSTFSAWVLEQKKPSVENAKKIEMLLGIPREEIRPDIFGK